MARVKSPTAARASLGTARWLGALAALGLALLALPACGGGGELAPTPNVLVGKELPAAQGPRVTLSISPEADANGALPFYMMARTVKEQTYLVEPYQSVADHVMTPDASVIKTWVMHPGQHQIINLELPKKGRLAIYAMFSQTAGNWRTLLPINPPGHVRVKISGMQMSAALDR